MRFAPGTCEAPTLTSQPTATSACFGGTALLTVTASGQNLTYQWRRGGLDIPGATYPTLVLPNLQLADFGAYYCEISNGCGFVTSDLAFVTREPGPAIVSFPFSIGACVGTDVTMVCEATGAVSYAWYKDGSLIQNGTSNIYTIANLSLADAGFYWCEVTGPGTCGTARSDSCAVSVFNTIPEFFAQPHDVLGCIGQPATFNVVTNPLSLRWYHNGQLIPGATSATLTIPSVTREAVGTYQCSATDFFCGTVFSDLAHLTLCAADVDDGSGTGTPDCGITIDDLLYYLFAFEAGDLNSDIDDGSGTGTPDGGVTIDDLLYYLLRFEQGC